MKYSEIKEMVLAVEKNIDGKTFKTARNILSSVQAWTATEHPDQFAAATIAKRRLIRKHREPTHCPNCGEWLYANEQELYCPREDFIQAR